MAEDTRSSPAKWQATATTVSCDRVDDFVTIVVNKDWSVNCTWYNRYKKGMSGTSSKRGLDAGLRKKMDNCSGPECPLVVEYRAKLVQEECSNGSQSF